MSYEEEDTCHMRRRIHTYTHVPYDVTMHARTSTSGQVSKCWCYTLIYMSYEEEDTCHMRRRIHVI
jgi:hypothetical protein